jgi:hypothetical protein
MSCVVSNDVTGLCVLSAECAFIGLHMKKENTPLVLLFRNLFCGQHELGSFSPPSQFFFHDVCSKAIHMQNNNMCQATTFCTQERVVIPLNYFLIPDTNL